MGMYLPNIRKKYGECLGAFWAGNEKVIAKISMGEISFGGPNTVIAKEFKIE
jgi:hypothetical protein